MHLSLPHQVALRASLAHINFSGVCKQRLSARRIGGGTLQRLAALGLALLRRDIEIAASLARVLTRAGVKRGGTSGLTLAGVDAPTGDVAFGCRGRHDVYRLVHCIEGAGSRYAECGAGRGAARRFTSGALAASGAQVISQDGARRALIVSQALPDTSNTRPAYSGQLCG